MKYRVFFSILVTTVLVATVLAGFGSAPDIADAQISPLPTWTSTNTPPPPPTPTNTPLPPTPTNTPLPPTPTNTPLPPTPTNTPTPIPPPAVGAISIDPSLVAVGMPVEASAPFVMPDTADLDTATWDWGDGTTSACPPDSATCAVDPGTGGDGLVTGSHAYSEAGVYVVLLTVLDVFGQFDTSRYEYAVVYDPDGSFVTGGGWIDSLAGAYRPDLSLTGKASFGFISRYKKGANRPTGNTQFQFQTADLSFHSDSYEWLVVNRDSTRAQFKGDGTINGAPSPNGDNYRFMLWATDGDGLGEEDTFRIKIWYEDGGSDVAVYDNGFDQSIGGGSITVHAGKDKE